MLEFYARTLARPQLHHLARSFGTIAPIVEPVPDAPIMEPVPEQQAHVPRKLLDESFVSIQNPGACSPVPVLVFDDA